MGQALLWALVGLLLCAFVGLGLVVYQLLRQQGRLLLRLETLERRASGAGQAPSAPRGLEVGDEVESFRLPDIAGEEVALADFRGRRVLLVHWSPGCGYCAKIAGELAELEGKLRSRDIELLLVSYGEAEPNLALAEEHGLSARILLQEAGKPVAAFRGLGTPVAYLLDEQGRVAAPLALGANEVPRLARAVAQGRRELASERPLAESRLEREGLKPGTPAPRFVLPEIRGGELGLQDYLGRRVLLVFSDPACAPCNALLPELAKLDDEDLAVIVVSRGDLDANIRKAEELGLDVPVVVQRGWRLSKQYGIFGTPVGYLIGEDGMIVREVAVGKDAITALGREAGAREAAPIAH